MTKGEMVEMTKGGIEGGGFVSGRFKNKVDYLKAVITYTRPPLCGGKPYRFATLRSANHLPLLRGGKNRAK